MSDPNLTENLTMSGSRVALSRRNDNIGEFSLDALIVQVCYYLIILLYQDSI